MCVRSAHVLNAPRVKRNIPTDTCVYTPAVTFTFNVSVWVAVQQYDQTTESRTSPPVADKSENQTCKTIIQTHNLQTVLTPQTCQKVFGTLWRLCSSLSSKRLQKELAVKRGKNPNTDEAPVCIPLTCLAYFVMYTASSAAESPPPTTATS